MLRLLWNATKAIPATLGAFFLLVNNACATQSSVSEIASTQTVTSEENEKLIRASKEVATNAGSPLLSIDVEASNPAYLTASEHNTTKVESVVSANAQLPQIEIEGSNLPLVTHLETNPTLDLVDSTAVQGIPAAETTTPDSTSTLKQINLYSNSDDGSGDDTADEAMEQVTNVSQLTDVAPGDWAYEALRSLVERYGCIAGYPDRTFRGNRATSRYEFAAGLNACLNQIERLIAASTSDFVRRKDLEVVQQLVREFQTELVTLGTQLDTLEGRVGFLEEHQFSITTRLTGNVDFGLLDAWGDKKAVPSGQIPTEDLNVNTIFPGRVNLAFDTSFTGKDRLRIKLEAGNFTPFNRAITGTDMTLYDFDTRTGPTGNNLVLGTLAYQFPVGDFLQVFIAPQGLGSPDVAPQLNPATGVFSRFGQRNPIYRLSDGAGLGLNLRFSDALQASFTYLVESGIVSRPNEKAGLFDGQFGALAQLTFSPTQSLSVAFTYVRYFSPEPSQGINVAGGTGSLFAQRPFGDDVATSANAFGIEGQYRISPRFAIGGWVGVTKAEAESANALARQGDEAEIWNYAVAVAFPGLGGQGNSLGFIFGMPPRARGNDVASRRDLDTSYRAEAFYRLKLTDNISITPGFFAIFNPEHNKANDTIYVGTLLTTFSF